VAYPTFLRILAPWLRNRSGGCVAYLGTKSLPASACALYRSGYTLDGRSKNIGNDGKFLYPVQQLSAAFKAKLLDSLKRALRKTNQLLLFNDAIQKAYLSPWVVHCEPTLASADHVVRYLGQYTHRVAITNQRILSIADGKVTFIAKDYTDRGMKNVVKLDGEEFIRRFSQHILPVGFVKIRHFGIYNHTVKRSLNLVFTVQEKPEALKQKETTLERFEKITGQTPCCCHVCKTGRMIRIRTLPRDSCTRYEHQHSTFNPT
jgi:hypothetical protein